LDSTVSPPGETLLNRSTTRNLNRTKQFPPMGKHFILAVDFKSIHPLVNATAVEEKRISTPQNAA